MKKFKSKKNLLRDYIFNNQMKQASEQTIKSLLRSIVEPVIQSNSEGVVLFRLFNSNGLESLLKRLDFSKVGVYFYSDISENVINVSEDDIWDSTEFAIVLAPRYAAAIIWDYGVSEVVGHSNISFYVNSRKIQDILKIVIDNSRIDFMPDVEPYSLERRENELMCDAIHKVIDCLNDSVLENYIMQATHSVKESKPQQSYAVREIIHEIRNNLSVINLHSKIIEKRIQKSDDADLISKILKANDIMASASHHVNVLLDDLKNNAELQIEVLDIRDIVHMAVEVAEPKLEKKNINVSIDVKDINILADEAKLLGVLLNIVNNAIYALRENGKLNFVIHEKEDDKISLIVENDGVEIPLDLQRKIFEEGFTTKSPDCEDGGSGLGLKISKTVMKAMGGDLILLKSDSASTIFEITIKRGEL